MEKTDQKFLNFHKNGFHNEKFAIGRNVTMNLTIILPCYNEEKNIPRIKTELVPALEKLELENYEIILVDDGSTDRTYEVAQNLNIPRLKIVRHEKNRNIGAAFKTGFGETKSDICLTYDSDLIKAPLSTGVSLADWLIPSIEFCLGRK